MSKAKKGTYRKHFIGLFVNVFSDSILATSDWTISLFSVWWCTFFLPCTTVFPKVIAWWCFHVCSSGMQNHYYSDIHTHSRWVFFSLQSEHFSVWMRQSLWGKVAAAPTMSSVWKSKEKGRCLENDNQEEKEIVWNGFFSLPYCYTTYMTLDCGRQLDFSSSAASAASSQD